MNYGKRDGSDMAFFIVRITFYYLYSGDAGLFFAWFFDRPSGLQLRILTSIERPEAMINKFLFLMCLHGKDLPLSGLENFFDSF
jgi:hypothetical protein